MKKYRTGRQNLRKLNNIFYTPFLLFLFSELRAQIADLTKAVQQLSQKGGNGKFSFLIYVFALRWMDEYITLYD